MRSCLHFVLRWTWEIATWKIQPQNHHFSSSLRLFFFLLFWSTTSYGNENEEKKKKSQHSKRENYYWRVPEEHKIDTMHTQNTHNIHKHQQQPSHPVHVRINVKYIIEMHLTIDILMWCANANQPTSQTRWWPAKRITNHSRWIAISFHLYSVLHIFFQFFFYYLSCFRFVCVCVCVCMLVLPSKSKISRRVLRVLASIARSCLRIKMSKWSCACGKETQEKKPQQTERKKSIHRTCDHELIIFSFVLFV